MHGSTRAGRRNPNDRKLARDEIFSLSLLQSVLHLKTFGTALTIQSYGPHAAEAIYRYVSYAPGQATSRCKKIENNRRKLYGIWTQKTTYETPPTPQPWFATAFFAGNN